MKKTFKTMLALMAGAVAFTACSNDDITEDINEQKTSALKPMTFTASMEGQGGASRAAIDELDINWVDDDKIAIFDGGDADTDGNLAREFTLTGGFGTTSGTFEGYAAEDADVYYALYPYASSTYEEEKVTVDKTYLANHGINWGYEHDNDWDDNRSKGKSVDDYIEQNVVGMMPAFKGISAEQKAILKAYLSNEQYKEIIKSGVLCNEDKFEEVVFPANQTATAGSADPAAMLMIGKSEDASIIQFSNVCAYVKVTPQFACTEISIESKGTESLAGTVTLDYNGGTPTASVTANGTNKVLITGTIAANTTYYIAVLPATLSSGFTLSFKTSDGGYEKSTTKTLTLARNKVIDLGSFATDDLTKEAAAPEGALSGKFNVSDTKQVYFAKGNLYYDGNAFQLEENQYDIATSWGTGSHVSNFFWSNKAEEAYADSFEDEEAETGDVFFTNAADFTVNGQTGVWRTLSNDEWNYLFEHYAYKYTTVCSKPGLVIAPTSDATTIAESYDTTTAWATAESKGFVFLPNTGYRYEAVIDETGISCIYWSSTLCPDSGSDNFEKPYRKFFQWKGTYLSEKFYDANNCNYGIGIRLVADVQ